MCFRKRYPLKTSTMGWWLVPPFWIRHFVSLASDLIHKFCDFYMFPIFSSLCLYNFYHFHIYLVHRNDRRNASVRILLNFPVLLNSFHSKIHTVHQFGGFFMPLFPALIRVQSNPGIKRTPRLQKMAYYNLITGSNGFIRDARAYVFQKYKEQMRNIKTKRIKLNRPL